MSDDIRLTRDEGAPPLLVLSDDWGRHPSSCQHLVRRLLPRYEVLWVNVIGMRPPRLDLWTLKRGCEKAAQWLRRGRQAPERPEGLRVVSPVMWPRFRTRLDRWANRTLLRRALLPLVEALPAPPVAVTTQPTMAELVGVLPVRRWVYYCVDDFTEWPGLDHATVHRLEERLIDRADTIVAASETLRQKAERRGRTATLLTHGVDLDLWGAARDGDDLPGLQGLERPLVVFWGLLDRRLDLALLGRLARDMERGTVLLVGPGEDIDPALTALPRVTRLPALPYERLPELAREAAVLVLPYIDAPVTHAIQPLKLKEYLATGKPVVARDLPAVRAWADCLDMAATPEEFSAAVRRRAAEGVPDEHLCARARLAAESWEAKAEAFERAAVADDAAAPLAGSAR